MRRGATSKKTTQSADTVISKCRPTRITAEARERTVKAAANRHDVLIPSGGAGRISNVKLGSLTLVVMDGG